MWSTSVSATRMRRGVKTTDWLCVVRQNLLYSKCQPARNYDGDFLNLFPAFEAGPGKKIEIKSKKFYPCFWVGQLYTACTATWSALASCEPMQQVEFEIWMTNRGQERFLCAAILYFAKQCYNYFVFYRLRNDLVKKATLLDKLNQSAASKDDRIHVLQTKLRSSDKQESLLKQEVARKRQLANLDKKMHKVWDCSLNLV